MATLHILRHAKAKPAPDLNDIQRLLAERGLRDSNRMGSLIAKSGIPPTLILCSSAQRARGNAVRLAITSYRELSNRD